MAVVSGGGVKEQVASGLLIPDPCVQQFGKAQGVDGAFLALGVDDGRRCDAGGEQLMHPHRGLGGAGAERGGHSGTTGT